MHKVVPLLISCILFFSPAAANFTQEASIATNRFSLDLLKTLLQNSTGNAVVSPVSVYTLLVILQQGARGDTLQEVDNVVHAEPAHTKESYRSLTTRYQRIHSRHTDLQFATKAFADSHFQLKPEFQQTLLSDFHSGIEPVEFSHPENASAHINSWVSQSTNQKITRLFEPNDLEADTVLVLVNAVYFHSHWDDYFPAATSKSFSPSNGVEIHVPTLEYVREFHAGKCHHIGAKYVHLDFLNMNDFTVLLILPTERYGLDAVLNHLTAENLTQIFSHTGQKKVTLQFPKFRLKSESNLASALQNLGIHKAFQDSADLSGITAVPIKVSKVIQKAEILADEQGVTAAAATGLAMRPMMGRVHPPLEEMDFIADHPFLFFIVDRRSHVPLFAGRVTNPSLE